MALQANLYAGNANVYQADEDGAIEAALTTLTVRASPDVGQLADPAGDLQRAGDLLVHLTQELYGRIGSSAPPLRDSPFLSGPYAMGMLALSGQDPGRMAETWVPAGGGSVNVSAAFRAILIDYFKYLGTAPVGYGNREFSPRLAWAVAYRMFPTDADATLTAARSALTAYWNAFVGASQQDPFENSGNYSAIGLIVALHFSDALGMTDPGNPSAMGTSCYGLPPLGEPFRAAVRRYAKLATSSGYMPEFGDDYLALIRLRNVEESLNWPYLFERVGQWAPADAAMLYKGRAMAARARQYHNRALSAYTGAAAPQQVALATTERSAKTYRSTLQSSPGPTIAPAQATLPERLILRSSAEPNSPSAVLDLLGRADHGHMSQRGALQWYEVSQVPLFFNYGRYLQPFFYTNALAFAPDANTYPFSANSGVNAPQPSQDGNVHLVTVPTSVFLFRDYNKADTAATTPFRLTALPASGVGTCPVHNANYRLLDRNGVAHAAAVGGVYDAYTYPMLAYDANMPAQSNSNCSNEQVRLAGAPGTTAGDASNVAGVVTYHHVYDAWQPPISVPMVDVDDGQAADGSPLTFVQDHNGDASGQITFFRWGTHDSTGTRRVLLTQEGLLVLVDTLTPGPRANGWVAGPLWQIYTLASPYGSDWYAETGEVAYGDVGNPNATRKMGFVVRFASSDPQASSAVASSVWGQTTAERTLVPNMVARNYASNAAFIRSQLRQGQQVSFVTAVVPGPAGSNWASVARGMALSVDAAGNLQATIAATASGGVLAHDLAISLQSGTWQVVRK